MNKVFLGGTCNESKWREELIANLEIDYFNPVVDDWNKEAQEEEERQKDICNYQLFVITPKMTGVFSIAEVVDCSNKYPKKTIFHIIAEDEEKLFTDGQMKSLKAVYDLVKSNGGNCFESLSDVWNFLNEI